MVDKHKEGVTIRELSKEYNKPFKTIKNMITREINKLKKKEVHLPKRGDLKPYYDCLKTFINKVEEQKEPIILHTDQGSIYSSKAFAKTHEHCTGINRSMSKVATPTDNPIIEALNGWIKEELYIDFGLYRSKNVPLLIDNYIKYFNNYRLSSKLQYKPLSNLELNRGLPKRTFLLSIFP